MARRMKEGKYERDPRLRRGIGTPRPRDRQRPSAFAGHIQNLGVTLRLMWNERGAADIVKLENELSQMMGSTAAGPYLKSLERALRKLDR
jgi:hypothetical protein